MNDALAELSSLGDLPLLREPPTAKELRAELEREVRRVAALGIAGVSAAVVGEASPAEGYRAASGRAPIVSLEIRLRAGLSVGATMALVMVWMAMMLGLAFVAIATGLPPTPLFVVALFAVPSLLIAVPTHLLTRERRMEMTSTELRIHPPRALLLATPRVYSLDDVGPVHSTRPYRRGWTLVTVTQLGETIELFSEVPSTVIDADLPRVMRAYRAMTIGAPS